MLQEVVRLFKINTKNRRLVVFQFIVIFYLGKLDKLNVV